MQLNKADSMPAPRNESVKSTASPRLNAAAKNISGRSILVPRSIGSLTASLGLPLDKLSASIISFARFFSLPLKPELLAAIRRQAFVPARQSAQSAVQVISEAAQTEAAKKTTANSTFSQMRAHLHTALSLAAAESKGVELHPKGIEAYAEAVDPDQRRKQNSDEQEKEKRNQNKDSDDAQEKTGAINSAVLKKSALESTEKNQMLSIMNKLPGKNGQRWIVLPFDFCEDGRDFRVSMRILLEETSAVLMALDVIELDKDTRQSFALEFSNNKLSRLTYYCQSEQNQKLQDSNRRKLASFLEIPVENVFVKTGGFLCEAEYGENLLCSIDEAV